MEDALAERPLEVLAIASGVSFGLGALTGSRVARMAVAFAAGLAWATLRRPRIVRRVPVRHG